MPAYVRSAQRIIPTRVGTSEMRAIENTEGLDHPHACGDKLLLVIKSFTLLGSSPRVWGQAGTATITVA